MKLRALYSKQNFYNLHNLYEGKKEGRRFCCGAKGARARARARARCGGGSTLGKKNGARSDSGSTSQTKIICKLLRINTGKKWGEVP